MPEGGGRVACEVLNISVGGALTRIPLDDDWVRAIGERLLFGIVDHDSGAGLELDARLVHCRRLANCEHVGLQFIDARQAEALLNPVLMRLFNRRSNYRVEPDPALPPIWVTVQALEPPGISLQQARLLDLATGGIGLLGSLDFEGALAGVTDLECTLFLPDTQLPISLQAQVLHRTLIDSSVRYGLSFVEDGSPTGQRTQEVLLSYVIRRQREMGRGGASRGIHMPYFGQQT